MEEAKTRIKITIGNATIEVEGSQDYIEKKLKEADSFSGLVKQVGEAVPAVSPEVKAKGQKVKPAKRKRVTKGIESHNLVTDLDLSGTETIPSLKDFYKEKNPTSYMEGNTVFVYYLKKIRNMESVGVDHIYTCYKHVGAKAPGRLYQSLADTRNRKGWIITDNMDDLRIGTLGENFVEKELPKPPQPK